MTEHALSCTRLRDAGDQVPDHVPVVDVLARGTGVWSNGEGPAERREIMFTVRILSVVPISKGWGKAVASCGAFALLLTPAPAHPRSR